jgi:hypothetical protein
MWLQETKNIFNKRDKRKKSMVRYYKAGVHMVVFVALLECCAVSLRNSRYSDEACGRSVPDYPDNGSL